MILTFTFVLPLLAAVACLALDRLVETRLLGFGGAVVLAICAGLLFAARSANALGLITQPWLTVEDQVITLALGFDAASWGFAVLVAAGGALALLALALALPRTLRAYGSLIATLLLLVEMTLLGLASREMLLLPIAWAALPLLGFTALRASGGQNEAQTLPVGLLGNLLGAVLLLGAALISRFAVGAVPDIALLAMLVAMMLAIGLPPFHRGVSDMALAPANVAAPLVAFGPALLGGFVLVRFVAEAPLPGSWHPAFQLVGLAATVICAAAAVQERRLRRLIGWLTSAQFGLLLVSLGLNQAAAATIAPALLLNVALVTCVSLLAVGLIERRSGTDNLDEIKLGVPLLLPGAGFLLAAASAVGVPGTWGFWPVGWLFSELAVETPLFVGPLLGGIALLALAWLAPLVAFLRVSQLNSTPEGGASLLARFCPLIGALPLLVFGVVPQLLWNNWGADARLALLGRTTIVLTDPSLPDTAGSITAGAAIGVLALLVLGLRHTSARRTLQSVDVEPSGIVTPDGLGETLRGISWLGAPSLAFAQLWRGFEALSRRFGWLLSFFEQRYFMAGLILAVVAVIFLLVQG